MNRAVRGVVVLVVSLACAAATHWSVSDRAYVPNPARISRVGGPTPPNETGRVFVFPEMTMDLDLVGTFVGRNSSVALYLHDDGFFFFCRLEPDATGRMAWSGEESYGGMWTFLAPDRIELLPAKRIVHPIVHVRRSGNGTPLIELPDSGEAPLGAPFAGS